MLSFFQAITAVIQGIAQHIAPFLHNSLQISEDSNHGHKDHSCWPFTAIASFFPHHLFKP